MDLNLFQFKDKKLEEISLLKSRGNDETWIQKT